MGDDVTTKKIYWTDAIERARDFLQNNAASPEWRAKIYTWEGTEKLLGVRVSEVDFCYGTPGMAGSGGSSYMQVDVPWGACVCLCVERLIIAYAEQWPADEIEEEEQRLVYAIKGTNP